MASKLKNQLHTYPPGASETGCAYPYCPDPMANNIVLDDLNAVIDQTNFSNEIQQLLAVGLPAQSALAPEYYHIVCDHEYVDPTQLSGIVADFCLCYQDPEQAASQHIDCELLSDVYWYHPDYVGSNELITDITGEPYQYFFYTPFGETILQEDAFNASYVNPWRFNGKELDPETGNYYYGARSRRDFEHKPKRRSAMLARPSPAFWRGYYNPKWSIWLSVDPLAHMYPSLSPYVFVANNPVMLVDPDGKRIIDYFDINCENIGTDGNDKDQPKVVITSNRLVKRIREADNIEGITVYDKKVQKNSFVLPDDNLLEAAYRNLETALKDWEDNGLNREWIVSVYKDGLSTGSKPGPVMDLGLGYAQARVPGINGKSQSELYGVAHTHPLGFILHPEFQSPMYISDYHPTGDDRTGVFRMAEWNIISGRIYPTEFINGRPINGTPSLGHNFFRNGSQIGTLSHEALAKILKL